MGEQPVPLTGLKGLTHGLLAGAFELDKDHPAILDEQAIWSTVAADPLELADEPAVLFSPDTDRVLDL